MNGKVGMERERKRFASFTVVGLGVYESFLCCSLCVVTKLGLNLKLLIVENSVSQYLIVYDRSFWRVTL